MAARVRSIVAAGALLAVAGASLWLSTTSADTRPPAVAIPTAGPAAVSGSTPTPAVSPTSAAATATPAAPSPTAPPPSAPPAPSLQLPRGGTTVFPAYRLLGYAGYPGVPGLGRLGIGSLEDRVAEIEDLGGRYAAGRRPLPVLELIATVVRGGPGPDGNYRARIDESVVDRFLATARAHHAVLLLDIQPGRADFLPEVRAWERWLREPDVGVALDPEWAVGPDQIPGKVFGSTTGAELDSVAAYLSGLVAQGGLPEKVMLYHQLAPAIVRDPGGLKEHPGVSLVVSVDGIGTPAQKAGTWRQVVALTPPYVHKGIKLFFEEDAAKGPLMTPAQVLALRPQPEYVLYE